MARSPQSRALGPLVAAALLSGCVPGYVRVVLQTTPDTNAKAPLYLLARKVEPKDYAAQPYSEIAKLLDLADATVVRRQLLYPGRKYSFYLKKPEKEALGLYFLFTDPGGAWRLLLERPLPWQVRASLRGNLVGREVAR